MSKLLRILAGVCLLIGIFTAIDVLAGRRHVFEAATWFILEFVLLWMNEMFIGPTTTAWDSRETAHVASRLQSEDEVGAVVHPVRRQEGPSLATTGRHPTTGVRRPSPTPSYVRIRGAHRLRQHEQGSAFSVLNRGQR